MLKSTEERFLVPLLNGDEYEILANPVTVLEAQCEEGEYPLNRWNIVAAIIKQQMGNSSATVTTQRMREITSQIDWPRVKMAQASAPVSWGTCPDCGLFDPTGIGQGAKCPNCS